jgi:hypothetical protein
VMDESYLTGEPPHVEVRWLRGVVRIGQWRRAPTIRADRHASDSRYAKIMRVMASRSAPPAPATARRSARAFTRRWPSPSCPHCVGRQR